MSFLMRQVAHCDVCGHEWLTKKVPSHCAKCKSRKWNGPKNAEVRQLPQPWADLRAEHKRRNKHAATCKCLMCKPPK